MKAAVHDRYGPPEVLRLEDVEPPVAGDEAIRIRVHAATVNRTDCHRRGAYPFFWRLILGLRRPRNRVLGMEFAGVVDSAGAAVEGFAVGDAVFGLTNFGAHAELLCVSAHKAVAHKPANVTFNQAAAIPDGAFSALGCLRNSRVGPRTNLLVYGASGSVGTAAVQLAKHMGARVTAVCNTKNLELVRSLGADAVLDYTRGDDFTKNQNTYDVVIDAVGKHSFIRSRRALKPGGRYVPTDGLRNLFLAPLSLFGSRRMVGPGLPRAAKDDLLFLKRLIEDGQYRAVIDRTYRLEDIVEAHRYVETLQKAGNVVLRVGDETGFQQATK